MSLNRRRVDQHLRRRAAGRCQGVEVVHPDTFGRPAHKTIVERLARTIDRRRIGPATAGLQHMHDPADHATIIDPGFAPGIARKMGLKPSELPFFQPKIISIHPWSPFGNLESRNAPAGNPLYGSGAWPTLCPSRKLTTILRR